MTVNQLSDYRHNTASSCIFTLKTYVGVKHEGFILSIIPL
jgi:hypothetical protein